MKPFVVFLVVCVFACPASQAQAKSGTPVSGRSEVGPLPIHAVSARRAKEPPRVEIGTAATYALWKNHGPEYWHWQHVKALRRVKVLERRLQRRWRPTADYAIRLASSTFGVSLWELRSVAACETGGSFNVFSYNRGSGASGLMQFLPSTWAAQGIAGFSVWDPVANVLAAARIVAREGWRQWACSP